MFGLNIDTKVLIYASIAVIVVGSIVIYIIRNNRKVNKDIQEIKDVMIKQHKYAENNFIEISNLFKSMNLRIQDRGNSSQKNVQFSNVNHTIRNVNKEEEIEDEEEINETPQEMLKVPRQNIVVTAIYERPVQKVESADIEVIEDEDKALEEAERLLNNTNEINESGCKDGVCDINSVLADRKLEKEEREIEEIETINIPIKQSKKKVKKVE